MVDRIGYRNLRHTLDSRGVVPLVRELIPDLIILDLTMPHVDGFQVMQQLAAVIPADAVLPILVLTPMLHLRRSGRRWPRVRPLSCTSLSTRPRFSCASVI